MRNYLNILISLAVISTAFLSCERNLDDTTKNNPKELTVTGDATEITEISASISGYANLTPDLGAVKIGILYSTEENPSEDNVIEIVSSAIDKDNKYVVKAANLASNTVYYYTSFVEFGGVYHIGNKKSFKTKEVVASVSTLPIANVERFSAELSGKLSYKAQGDLPVKVGFAISETYHTVEDILNSGFYVDGKLGNEDVFTGNVQGLQDGTIYYYVTWARVHDQLIYSDVNTFSTTNIKAAIETLPPTEVGFFDAVLNGTLSVENDRGLSKTVFFLYSDTYSTADDLINHGLSSYASMSEGNTIRQKIERLIAGGVYFYMACAKVEGRYFYGEVKSFKTVDYGADLHTLSASDITINSATLNATVTTFNADSFISNYWFIYSDSFSDLDGLISNGKREYAGHYLEGPFSRALTGLKCSTKYYYVVYSKINDRDFYGEVLSFSTSDISSQVYTNDATDVGSISATLNGTLDFGNAGALSKYVLFMISSTATTAEAILQQGESYASNLTETGTFSATIRGLSANCRYYYIAYAEVGNFSIIGDVQVFTTMAMPDNVVDLGVSVLWATYNVGASNQEELGDKFAWGEVESKTGFYRSNYKWYDRNENLLKYITSREYGDIDGKSLLDDEDDAARVNWGERWRMPTVSEMKELETVCTWKFAQMGEIVGMIGKSKINGNSIFIPGGMYWLKDVDNSVNHRAPAFKVDNSFGGWNEFRYRGFLIRPITY